MSDMQMMGNIGCYLDDNNIISFQIGTNPASFSMDPGFESPALETFGSIQWMNVQGYKVAARGPGNRQCIEIERDIKNNRLLPELILKQCRMLYGTGLTVYRTVIEGNEKRREWEKHPVIESWLDSWQDNGMEMSHTDFATALINNHYTFRDYFIKHRMTRGKAIGGYPIAGLELLENKECLLATSKQELATENITYKDFRTIVVGNWQYGAAQFKVYPKFDIRDVKDYRFAAISHHREYSPGEFYGLNKTYQGTKAFIRGSNKTPQYINSFLENSLAAKVHIIIPNAWIESKRKQIKAICDENKTREKNGDKQLLYNGIQVGTTFKESSVIEYIQVELRKLSKYLSGADNQGKAYSSISFRSGNNEEERWKIETLDLKYKEYISSLIDYDKRADEVLIAAVGLDASISGISKDGVISKSGSDAYYNYIIHLLSLTPDDEKCSEPFNLALKVNFPELYHQGYRLGYYRQVPTRQEQVSPKDRIQNKQS
ncbi:MAG: hypothetical protein LUG98_09460 [Tannerellaceae bacterium]|nr:hypothetical protein [Tannerellaceae bacterium]